MNTRWIYKMYVYIENDLSPSVIKGNSTSSFIYWKCNAIDVMYFIFILRIKYEYICIISWYVFKNITCLFDIGWILKLTGILLLLSVSASFSRNTMDFPCILGRGDFFFIWQIAFSALNIVNLNLTTNFFKHAQEFLSRALYLYKKQVSYSRWIYIQTKHTHISIFIL